MLVRWNATYDPFLSDFRTLQRQMDRVFRDLLPVRELSPRRSTWNVIEDGERYVVTASLPGMKKDELSIEATEHELTIKGKRSIVKRVVERVRSRFNASVAEVEDMDVHRRAVIGIVVVSNDGRHANSMLDTIADFVAGASEAVIVGRSMEILHVDPGGFGR